ncbi:NAD(P)-binding protein [Meredithblackwellia eburnea MCA 4105]
MTVSTSNSAAQLNPPHPDFNTTQKQFWVIGYPIAKSKSPLIHSTGYKSACLPHRYEIHEVKELDEEDIQSKFGDESFGGASITMPFKLPIMRYVQEITPAAKLLGAANTISPKWTSEGARYLEGHNTDWLGIRNVLLRGLKTSHKQASDSTGLIVGAGGAARAAVYALGELGIKHIYIFNRTRSRVNEIQADFAGYDKVTIYAITSLSESEFTFGNPLFVVGTVPAKGTFVPGQDASHEADALLLDGAAFSRIDGGVMLDMAYLPKRTPLIRLAETYTKFETYYGIDVLIQQAAAQFSMWTGVEAPLAEMEKATLAKYEVEQAEASISSGVA